jgi:hypothetical protein
MTTRAPVRKVHDIPIIIPERQPRRLTEPDRKWIVPDRVAVPERVKEPVRR